MRILSKYIAKNILASTLLVLLVLLALYTFMDFITELDDLGEGDYGIGSILSYIALTMPKRIYELLPVAALLGSVIGLGSMASQSELVAMRAAGYSLGDINKAVVVVAALLMLLALLIGEGLRPVTEQYARELQSVAQTGTVGSRSEHGFWTRDGNHFNHIDRINADGSFSNVAIYEFDDNHRLRILTRAARAEYQDDSWILSDVVQSTINEAGVKVRSVTHARWQSQLNPGMVNIVVVPPEFLPVWDLLEYVRYLKDNHQSVAQYELAFWSKLMMPVSTAVMVLLAVPFVFGPLRSAPIGGRILAGALIGIGFHLFNQSFQHMGLVFGLVPWLASSFPTMMFAGLAWWLNTRVR
ncbi:LPS export ABC transporter permease LptG [Methylophaga sp.]|jgi:lipopolysaccharide export system permease protein|uniref:LPS export ABC transporter permease LptG n=1 Tax=Methylophaga sp. TaxID=2024840 RepID=UPI0013FF6C47|nr:LPS export ABC transporter permease LptG [Methylophaga sp.]MTI62352.1 LPS export ABC transporter permease LptG [Methylophaga sp.]